MCGYLELSLELSLLRIPLEPLLFMLLGSPLPQCPMLEQADSSTVMQKSKAYFMAHLR